MGNILLGNTTARAYLRDYLVQSTCFMYMGKLRLEENEACSRSQRTWAKLDVEHGSLGETHAILCLYTRAIC